MIHSVFDFGDRLVREVMVPRVDVVAAPLSGPRDLEDLLEELVGDISDEYDRTQAEVEKLAEGQFRVSGRLSVDRLNGLVGGEMPDGDWDTVAGLIFASLGAVPEPGAAIRHNDVVLTVERMSGQRIAEVLVTVDPNSA